MKLSYDILWFEDQFDKVEPLVNRLCRVIKQKNLEPIVERKTSINVEEIIELSNRLEKNNPYDIVICDLDMGSNSQDGIEIASRLRQSIYTDMVFYSASALKEVKQRVFDNDIQGVFVTDKTQFNVDVKQIVEDHIKKMSSVNGARGLIMSEWSLLEVQLREKIKSKIENLPEDKKEIQKEKITNRIIEQLEGKIEKVKEVTNSSELLEDQFLCEFSMVRRTINSAFVGSNGFEDRGVVHEMVKERNHLAHNPQELHDDGSMTITDPKGVKKEYNIKQFNEIRKNLYSIKKIIDDF